MKKIQSTIIGVAAVALIASLAAVPMFFDQSAEAKNTSKIRMQDTVGSIADPFPGHESHDIVIMLPIEKDALYSGTLTFSASHPVEVVVWHEYDQPENSPANTFQVTKDGQQYAFSLVMLGEKGEGGIPTSEGGVRSASIPFAGSGLAVHALNGEPFTVSYSIDGWKRTLVE